MIKTCIFFALLCINFLSATALASGSAPGEIPGDVKYQLLNLTLFLFILVYFAGAKVKNSFSQRHEDFHRMARETEKARKALENKKAEVIRLTKQLRDTYDLSLVQAQQEAQLALKDQLQKASEEAARLSREASSQLRSDSSKLMEKLRLEALQMSMDTAQNKLGSLEASDKSKINSTFAGRVESATL